MRIRQVLIGAVVLCAMTAGAAPAQQVGDEIVIPAGSFSKDGEGIVFESGGHAGTGVQSGAFKFPKEKAGFDGTTLVGVTTLVPASWIGHEIDIVFGGSAGALLGAQFRIVGQIDFDPIAVTASLGAEDWGTTDVTIVSGYTVSQRRFAIAVGRQPGHPGDTAPMMMNLEYLVLRLTN